MTIHFNNPAERALHQAMDKYLKLDGVVKIGFNDHNDDKIIAIYVKKKYYFYIFDQVAPEINGIRIIIFIIN